MVSGQHYIFSWFWWKKWLFQWFDEIGWNRIIWKNLIIWHNLNNLIYKEGREVAVCAHAHDTKSEFTHKRLSATISLYCIIVVLVLKCPHQAAPTYLDELRSQVSESADLRSAASTPLRNNEILPLFLVRACRTHCCCQFVTHHWHWLSSVRS